MMSLRRNQRQRRSSKWMNDAASDFTLAVDLAKREEVVED